MLGAPAAAEIVAARYTEPTAIYDHAVLGDALEWRTLEMTLAGGRVLRARLPDDMVFEDLEPRLWDVTGDGLPEIVSVETSLTRGARLAVWDAAGRLAATSFIGRPNRWLAPLGAADLDGDGRIEIAYVDRPHLARELRLLRLVDGVLRPVARLGGVTNHRIGETAIHGGVRDCGAGRELIAADADWSAVLAIRFDGRTVTARHVAPWTADGARRALNCR